MDDRREHTRGHDPRVAEGLGERPRPGGPESRETLREARRGRGADDDELVPAIADGHRARDRIERLGEGPQGLVAPGHPVGVVEVPEAREVEEGDLDVGVGEPRHLGEEPLEVGEVGVEGEPGAAVPVRQGEMGPAEAAGEGPAGLERQPAISTESHVLSGP